MATSGSAVSPYEKKQFEKLHRGGRWGIIIGVVGILISAFAFYWYEWRPSQAVKDCHKIATERGLKESSIDFFYKLCMREKGFE